MTPREDQFNEQRDEVFIPFDEAGEARYPRRAPDEHGEIVSSDTECI